MAERPGPVSFCENGVTPKPPSRWLGELFISETYFPKWIIYFRNPIQIQKCISESDLYGLKPLDVPPAKCVQTKSVKCPTRLAAGLTLISMS